MEGPANRGVRIAGLALPAQRCQFFLRAAGLARRPQSARGAGRVARPEHQATRHDLFWPAQPCASGCASARCAGRAAQCVATTFKNSFMSAKSVMVLGTTSGAGKSWLTTALCRYYARQGLKVAPFKAQNMSNNARVVAQGEIGSAQYFQSLAANAVPDVRMNPLLLKPEKDTQSQVVLMGQVNAELSRMEWRGRSASVWPVVSRA